MIIKKCKNCGREYEANSNSQKYCTREECKKERNVLYHKRFNDRRQEAFNRLRAEEKQAKEEKFVDRKGLTTFKKNMTSIVIEWAKQIQQIRVDMCVQLSKINDVVANSYKAEQDLLHKLELIDTLSDEEAIEVVKELKKIRKARREYKDIGWVIKGLVESATPCEKPVLLVHERIKKTEEQVYTSKAEMNIKEIIIE